MTAQEEKLAKLGAAPAAASVAGGEAAQEWKSPEEMYEYAVGQVKGGNPRKGREILTSLAAKYPDHKLLPNALYWKGEAFYAEKDYENAILAFPGWAVGHRVGYAHPDRREFTVTQARQAKLWGKAGPWQEYPARMLAWRALGLLARDVFPDVLGGFPIAEEAEDFTPVPVASRGERAQPPPPSTPDPLMGALGVEPPVSRPPADAAPFPSHAEADKAIARAEGEPSLFDR